MKTTLDEITVNTLEEFLDAYNQGYYIGNIKYYFDEKELFDYFDKNKNNSADDMYVYANLLLHGVGTEIDHKNAMIYAKKAADYGNHHAMNTVGYMYSTGTGVERDDNIAFEYFKRAAENGDANGYYNLGIYYFNGYCVDTDIDKALEMYQKAEELGQMDSIVGQADIYYDKKEYDKAFSLYEKAANLNIEDSYLRYAYMLSQKRLGHLDYKKAAQIYQKLIDFNGNIGALNNLAIMYEKGQGVTEDRKKAFELYLKAAESGLALAYSNLGKCYFYGSGTEKDYEKAIECYEKAADDGYIKLYKIYNNGLGVEKDAEKAKYYLERALSTDIIELLLESSIAYILQIEKSILSKSPINKQEIKEHLNGIINKLAKIDEFLASYALAEIYYIFTIIDEEAYSEHNAKAIEYSKKAYEHTKWLANNKYIISLYGSDFFDFNEEYDYVCYDVNKFNGYEIAGRKITYVPSVSTRPNNNSIDFWLPRARLAYAMHCECKENEDTIILYKRAISVNYGRKITDFKDIVYPNAIYMYAVRYLIGYGVNKNESYATKMLKLCAERYHSRGVLLYGKGCELSKDYESAINYYKIAYSKVYPKAVTRKESLPTVLLKPGEKITYHYIYEYGGEKKPCYDALENIILNYQEFYKVSSAYEPYKVFEEYLTSGYKSTKINEICEAFAKYSQYEKYERLIEANLDTISSPRVLEAFLKSNKKEKALTVLDNILKVGALDDVKQAREISSRYSLDTQDRIVNRLIELGDKDAIATQLINSIADYNLIPTELVDLAKENNQIAITFFNENYEKSRAIFMLGVEVKAEKCIEQYSLELISNGEYETAKEIKPSLVNHSIWGYLLYVKYDSSLSEEIKDAIRLLKLPTELDVSDTAKEINERLLSGKRNLSKRDIADIISYANKTGDYLKCGMLLLANNAMECFMLLTKHYMNNTDNLLKLCDIALLIKCGAIDKDIFYFNKAMCLLSKGGFMNKNKAKSILKDMAISKHTSKLERVSLAPYQPAVDFLEGKEVNEEYLMNIRRKNG